MPQQSGELQRLLITLSSFSSLLFCFWDCGDIFRAPDLCLETLCAHTSTPPTPHMHTQSADTHTHTARLEPGPRVPSCSSTSEKQEPSLERALWWILCSACQCGSSDLQPADDRSTLSSQSSPACAASAPLLTDTQTKRCCESASIGGNGHPAGSGLENRIQPAGRGQVGVKERSRESTGTGLISASVLKEKAKHLDNR